MSVRGEFCLTVSKVPIWVEYEMTPSGEDVDDIRAFVNGVECWEVLSETVQQRLSAEAMRDAPAVAIDYGVDSERWR